MIGCKLDYRVAIIPRSALVTAMQQSAERTYETLMKTYRAGCEIVLTSLLSPKEIMHEAGHLQGFDEYSMVACGGTLLSCDHGHLFPFYTPSRVESMSIPQSRVESILRIAKGDNPLNKGFYVVAYYLDLKTPRICVAATDDAYTLLSPAAQSHQRACMGTQSDLASTNHVLQMILYGETDDLSTMGGFMKQEYMGLGGLHMTPETDGGRLFISASGKADRLDDLRAYTGVSSPRFIAFGANESDRNLLASVREERGYAYALDGSPESVLEVAQNHAITGFTPEGKTLADGLDRLVLKEAKPRLVTVPGTSIIFGVHSAAQKLLRELAQRSQRALSKAGSLTI